MKFGGRYFDPYDVWSIPIIGRLKTSYYRGGRVAKLMVAVVYLVDLVCPRLLRSLLRCRPSSFPHVDAMVLLAERDCAELSKIAPLALSSFRASSAHGEGCGWGLPFAWYSKNGEYPASTPYITNTPYVMEALVRLLSEVSSPEVQREAQELFDATWDFLSSLQPMYVAEGVRALSYSPFDEPRIVVNANSYAALAYALHAVYGKSARKAQALRVSRELVAWLIHVQGSDGSWQYYADDAPGNFIDCFHSCFVVKNLAKISALIPEWAPEIDASLSAGREYILRTFPDSGSGLCRRFSTRDIRDPFQWDIYDQAEFVGILIDMGRLGQAQQVMSAAHTWFRDGSDWYCRIDLLGRRWGRNYMRWGVMPLLYQQSRLARALQEGG